MRTRFGVLALAALPPIAACARKAPDARADSGATARAAGAAGVDRGAEEAAIRAQEQRWREVVGRRDTAAIASFYTADAIYAPQGRAPARGREAVSRMWAKDEFSAPNVSLERTPIRIEVATSGDVATEVGTYVFRAEDKGRRSEGRGTYMFAWRKEGGQWKASAYMWNAGAGPVLAEVK
jgi:ketosteroid isomerase-like protein